MYDRLPYFYSDQYDLGLEYVGLADRDAVVTIDADGHQAHPVAAALAVKLIQGVREAPCIRRLVPGADESEFLLRQFQVVLHHALY